MERHSLCRFFLKLLNFFLILIGLGIVSYGIFLLIKWNQSPLSDPEPSLSNSRNGLGRRFLLSTKVSHEVPEQWFIYIFIAIGGFLFLVSFFGCIGAAGRHRCCLSCYSASMIILVAAEVMLGFLISLDHDWKKKLPPNKSRNVDTMFDFLNKEWKYIRWVIVGAVALEAIAFAMALYLLSAHQPSDDPFESEDSVNQPISTEGE